MLGLKGWVQKIGLVVVALSVAAPDSQAASLSGANKQRLLSAYPDHLKEFDGDTLIWRDGTRMPLDDGQGVKPFVEWLQNPDIEDMFALPYEGGMLAGPPGKNADPGRARNAAFFDKMYGDCRKGEVEKNLTDVVWLAKKKGQHLRVTRVNGVAGKLAAISVELDQLPASLDTYLVPAEGTYACRVIAGTARTSAHGHGIAIDIATKHAHYWRWAKEAPNGTLEYRNKIPMEIVRIFEKHGFIWGGKWSHYDTMHFEYRPELMPPLEASVPSP